MLAVNPVVASLLWTSAVFASPAPAEIADIIKRSNHEKLPRAPKAKTSKTPPTDCDDGTWKLTQDNYIHFETDKNFRTWWAGGKNQDGPDYPPQPGKSPDYFLTYALGRQFFPTGAESQFGCTLEAGKCDPPDGCKNFGIRNSTTNDVGPPIHWSWFVAHSISTLSSFVHAFYEAFQSAGIQFNFNLLDLTDTFTKPSKNPELLTKDLLAGFSFLVSAAFALVPVAGPLLSVAAGTASTLATAGGVVGGALGAANGIFSTELTRGDATLDTKAKDFGKYMGTVWNTTATAIDNLVADMMSGKALDGATPLLMTVLNGGKWVDESIIVSDSASLSALQKLIYNDLLQRGINYIWKQSKIWVSYVNLSDDAKGTKCRGDKSGWQASKYCADKGVYYLYRFNEDGHFNGNLDYPWGADKMADTPYNLAPSWVSESSAMAYRTQNNGAGGFSFDSKKQPSNLQTLLESAGKRNSFADFHVLAGTWTIPVCDMGTHGDWNKDFTQDLNDDEKMTFPCCCGPKCSQTKDFYTAAQMNNFDTVVYQCKKQLASCAAWPAGVTQIDYGDSGTITKKDGDGDDCQ